MPRPMSLKTQQRILFTTQYKERLSVLKQDLMLAAADWKVRTGRIYASFSEAVWTRPDLREPVSTGEFLKYEQWLFATRASNKRKKDN